MKFLLSLFMCLTTTLIFCETSTFGEKSQKYLNDRIPSTDKRYPTFILALELLMQSHAKVIVETGTARGGSQNFIGDGGSTIILGEWAHDYQATLYSVDNDPAAVKLAKSVTGYYEDSVQVICSDSITFLENFEQPIDFLYLDSYDFDPHQPHLSQQHHLKEIVAAYPKLHPNSIVMIDDCDVIYGGKGELIIAFLLEKGWKIFFKGYQVILVH